MAVLAASKVTFNPTEPLAETSPTLKFKSSMPNDGVS